MKRGNNKQKMSVLDQVMDLKNRGISEQEIARRLQEQGISPGEITDAFSKAQIKSAVSYSGSVEEGMQPSILGAEEEPERLPLEGLEGSPPSDIDLTPPTPGGFMQMPRHVTQEVSGESETYEPQDTYYPQPQYQQYPQFQTPPQEGYEYAPSVSTGDTDTMIEVAEQVFSEKNKPVQKKVDEMNEFKTLAQTKIDNISDRLRRMENIIDKLQASILEKIGSYGHGLETVRKEMGMMQESFGKIVNKIADSTETRHHHIQSPQPQHHSQHHERHISIHKSRKTTRKHSKK